MSIRQGSIVEISLDASQARASSLKARIYDVIGKRFILSQTSPPLRPSHVNSTLFLSYISKDATPPRRLGFPATLKGLSRDYELASGVLVPALTVEATGNPRQISLRKSYRVHPTRGSGIVLFIGGREAEIVDISLAGVCFVQGFLLSEITPLKRLECLLTIDGKPYPVEAKVIRVAQAATPNHVAAAFGPLDRELQPVLSRKILMLERGLLSRGRR
jgi:hypothetical protein